MTEQMWLIAAVIGVITLLLVIWAVARRRQRVTLTEVDPMRPTLARDREVRPVAVAPLLIDSELTRMKGVGAQVAGLLAEHGVTRLDQVAAWSDVEAARVDAGLGAFAGRIARDRWVEQARLLNAGDRDGYEAEFGKIDGGAS